MSATAFSVRHGLVGITCQEGAALYVEHPLPVDDHTVSAVRTPVLPSTARVVPPTPRTLDDDAGNEVP